MILPQKINVKLIALSLLYIMPIAYLLWFIFCFGINVPVWDEWLLVGLFQAVSHKIITISHFFAQHNEHRILFPRLIFIVLAFISKWNLKVQMYFSVFLEIIAFYFIYKIAQYTSFKQDKKIFHLFNIITGFYLFAIWQSDNWLWGFQIAWHLVNLCLITAIFFLTVPQKIPNNLKLSGAALCCFIASFSMIHGLLTWLAVIPSVIAIKGTKKERLLRICLWLLLWVITCAIYSKNFHLSGNKNYLFLFEHFGESLKFFTIIVGLALPSNSEKIILNPLLNGLLILIIFLLFNIYLIKNYRSKIIEKIIPWLSLSWFPLLFAVVTTVGRAGVSPPTGSRFSTVSILLIISLLQIWRLLIFYQASWFQTKFYRFLSSYAIVGVLIAIWFMGSSNIIYTLKKNVNISYETPSLVNKMRGKTCLEIIYYLDQSFDISLDLSKGYSPQNCLHYLAAWKLRDSAIALEELGFRDFPKQIKFNSESRDMYGEIESPKTTGQVITLSRSNNLKLKGTINTLKNRKSPILLLLSYNDKQSFFADIPVDNQTEWKGQVSLQSLPLGKNIIKVWIYDQPANQFVKLKGEIELNIVDP